MPRRPYTGRGLARPPGRRYTPGWLRQLAEAYAWALARWELKAGPPPAKALAEQVGVPLRTAYWWLAEARRAGYLPATYGSARPVAAVAIADHVGRLRTSAPPQPRPVDRHALLAERFSVASERPALLAEQFGLPLKTPLARLSSPEPGRGLSPDQTTTVDGRGLVSMQDQPTVRQPADKTSEVGR